MEWYLALSLLLLAVIGLMALGVPVAFAFMVTNIVGVMIFMGGTTRSSGWSTARRR